MAHPNEAAQATVIRSSMEAYSMFDLCYFSVICLHRITVIFGSWLALLVHPAALAGHLWLLPRGLWGFISCQSPAGLLLQWTEVVCVPLKVDTFQIVLHFNATYGG